MENQWVLRGRFFKDGREATGSLPTFNVREHVECNSEGVRGEGTVHGSHAKSGPGPGPVTSARGTRERRGRDEVIPSAS